MGVRLAWPVRVAGLLVVLAVLAPLAWPGYVLRYDMVFVPQEHLSWNLLAPANALPRAVPLDAAVALANLVVPGWLLQRLALAAILYAATVGAARLVPTQRSLTRLVAGVAYAWTPFVAERLLVGQWALLCCYAALPWIVLACQEIRDGRRGAVPRLVLAAAAASLTPTGGVIATVTTLVLLVGRRKGSWPIFIVASLNAPWLVASFTSHASGGSDGGGVAAFAARSENWSGVIGALLGTGGVWSRLAAPDSRSWSIAPILTAVLLLLAVLGWRRLRAGLPDGMAVRLIFLASGGLLLAIAGATPPGAALLRFLVVHVPGAGLLRDGQKWLVPYALLLALCVACGVDALAQRSPKLNDVAMVALALPLLALPDLAWGAAGVLRPVQYPADWAKVAAIVDGSGGEVIGLPFAEYRRYAWNHGDVVIDPLARYVNAPVASDDVLYVSGVPIPGEDPRAADIHRHLDRGGTVRDLGIAWVVVEGPGVPASALAGLDAVYSGPDLTLYHNPAAAPAPRTTTGQRLTMGVAYGVPLLIALAAGIAPAASALTMRWRRRRQA